MPTIALGDPSIQAMSDKGAGVCMSQFFAESLQGGGDQSQTSDNLMNGVLGQMVNTALAMRLDSMIHPLDASLTWMHGVVSGAASSFYTTGRLTSEMVMKSAQMGVPVVISRSGITQMGYDLAERLGLCTLGRATNKHFLVYTAAQCVQLDPTLAQRGSAA